MLLLTTLTVSFIALSGLVALIDAAVLSVSRAETEEAVAHDLWGAKALKRITEQLTRSVVVIVIVTNIINILGPVLIGQIAVSTYGPVAIGWVTVILALLTIVFSEIVPKSLGTHYAPQVSRYAAFPVLVGTYALYPLVLMLDAFSRLFRRGRRRVGTETQIRALTTLGRRAGYIEPDEGLLVHKVFILNDRTAADIMTPRSRIASLPLESTVGEASSRVLGSGFSRYPVYGASLDDFRGFTLTRDILEAVARGHADHPLSTVVRKGLVVEADRSCDDLLLQFRLRRVHCAVVRRDSRTIGLVTLEDVLEELVGEISDEKDTAF